ncbi:hypothetical protein [Pseudoalteromonas sp. S201]|nr:hypothetical protein [Pseudoalteromonas sp. S201]
MKDGFVDVLETKPSLLQCKRVLPIITDKFKRFVDTLMTGF